MCACITSLRRTRRNRWSCSLATAPSLICPPSPCRLSQAGQTILSHRLALFPGTLQHLPDPRERTSLGNSTGIAFINRRSQRGKLRLKLPLLALQGPQGRANYFAGVVVPATFDFLQYEAVQLIRQIHVSSGHGGPRGVQPVAELAKLANTKP